MDERKARGTTIFCILPLTIISSIFYYKSNFIDWETSILCAFGGIIGGYIGAKILKKIPEKTLKIFFSIFIFYVAIRMIIN